MARPNEIDERILALLEEADDAGSVEEVMEIARKILAIDPESPYGKLLLAESLPEEEIPTAISLLEEAREDMKSEGLPETLSIERREDFTYGSILMNLGYMRHEQGDPDGALDPALELTEMDPEGFFPGRTILYRCLLELERYNDILDQTERDPLPTAIGKHARAIALYETEGPTEEAQLALWEALLADPDLPFYVLGVWELPEEEEIEEDEEETIHEAAYLIDPWNDTPERVSWLSRAAYLLGYVTGRLSEKEALVFQATLEDAGLLEQVDEVRREYDAAIQDEGNESVEELDRRIIKTLRDLTLGDDFFLK